MNVIAWLDFEHAFFDVAVQHASHNVYKSVYKSK